MRLRDDHERTTVERLTAEGWVYDPSELVEIAKGNLFPVEPQRAEEIAAQFAARLT